MPGSYSREQLPPASFAAVHGCIGVPEQLARVRPVVGEHGDADARSHEQLVPVDNERPADRAEQLLGHDAEPFSVAEARQQDREVVGTHARDRVAFAHRAREAPADPLQQLVADGVTEARIDLLEAVEVDHQDGQLLAQSPRALNRLVHAVLEEQLVRKARESVVRRLMADLAHEVGILQSRSTDGTDGFEQLHVVGVEPGDALAPADHEPLLLVVAQGQLHATFVTVRGGGAHPGVPRRRAAPSPNGRGSS